MFSAPKTVGLLATCAMMGFAFSAHAEERAPNTEERTAIEEALRQLGFTSWKEIELDDGKWEIDDAIHADGKKYDVDLEPGSLKVLKQVPDS